MTKNEAKQFFDGLKKKGYTDDDILSILYKMYQDDRLTLDQLEALCAVLGYEFTEEFKNMSLEDKKTKGVM